MCDFIFEHRERQRKKHFCLLRCLSAFATPIKLYFRCVFKLLPYVALAFGTTHLHGFTEKKIYAIDYRLVEGISRKIVRLKKYEDGIYNTEEYQHFAVIHVRLPKSGDIYDVEIELNEFQVQMAIDKLSVYKIGEDLMENLSVNEHKENEAVI